MQNQKTILPQADKSLAQQEMNSTTSSYRLEAPAVGTGLMDSEGGQKFCIEAALTSSSAQGGGQIAQFKTAPL